MSDRVRIETNIWDSGCLPPLLTREIAAVERELRVCGERFTAEAREQTDAYLGQLRNMLKAVDAARGVPGG